MDPKQAGRCTACFLMEDECSPAQPTLKFKLTRYVWISNSWANQYARKIDTFTTPFDKKMKRMQNVYSNLYSQAVTHPSTNRSQPCLTSVIGRELVYSRWYGRRHMQRGKTSTPSTKNVGGRAESCLDRGRNSAFCYRPVTFGGWPFLFLPNILKHQIFCISTFCSFR